MLTLGFSLETALNSISVYDSDTDSREYGGCGGLVRRSRIGGHFSGGTIVGSRSLLAYDFSSRSVADAGVRGCNGNFIILGRL